MKKKLEKKRYMILRISLAIECYEDATNNYLPEIKEMYQDIREYRNIKSNLTIEEELKVTNRIIEKFNNFINIVGPENFQIDDDGYVSFIGIK